MPETPAQDGGKTSGPQVFLVPKDQKLKAFLGLLFILPLLLLFGMRVAQARHLEHVPLRFVVFFVLGGVFCLLLILLFIFGLWLAYRYRDVHFELTDLGIAQVGSKGKIFIPWDAVEKAVETGVPVGIWVRDRSGASLKVPRFIQGYEVLRAEVLERCDKKRKAERPVQQVYFFQTWVNWLFGTLVLICLAATVGMSFILYHEFEPAQGWGSPKTLISLGLILIYGMGLAFLLNYVPKVIGSRIETDEEGIRRYDRKGNEVHIPWAWVKKVSYRPKMGQLGVFGRTEDKKIMVDFQFKGFETLKALILSKYESAFRSAPFPVLYRNGGWIQFSVVFLLAIGMAGFSVWFAYFNIDPDPARGLFLKLGALMFVGLVIFAPWEEYQRIREVRIDQEGVFLGRLSGSRSVPWEEMEWAYWNPEQVKKMVVSIGCRGGKVLEVPVSSKDILEVYLILKGRLGAKPS